MPDLNDKMKLSAKERGELVIQAGLQLIPCGIGASLSSLYFGAKQEKRFKRLEHFYQELEHHISRMREADTRRIKDNLEILSDENREYLISTIEEINERIEREHIGKKVNYFKYYFINTLLDPALQSNFDKRKIFLDAISSMTLLECEILGDIYNQRKLIMVEAIKKEGIDRYEVLGSINRLKSYGFIMTYRCSYFTETEEGAETDFKENIEISSLGRSFCEFCLTI